MLARRATLYRIVLPDYVCPDGALARHMLEEGGFEIDEHILATRIEADAFAACNRVYSNPCRVEVVS